MPGILQDPDCEWLTALIAVSRQVLAYDANRTDLCDRHRTDAGVWIASDGDIPVAGVIASTPLSDAVIHPSKGRRGMATTAALEVNRLSYPSINCNPLRR